MTDQGPRLWLVRHGQTDWNAAGRVQGHTPTSLNAHGRREAAEIAQMLAARAAGGSKFAGIWSSDLPRAFETAQAIGQALQLPITQTAALRERSFGTFEGATSGEIRAARSALGLAQNGDLADWTGMPGIESNDAVWSRVSETLLQIRGRFNGDRDVIVVTHGGVISRAMYRILGLDDAQPRRFSLANGIVMVIEWRDEVLFLLSLVNLLLLHGEQVEDTATMRK